MEEILASIRRIIADDDASKSAKPPESASPGPPRHAAAATLDEMNQADIDAMLADLDAPPKPAPAPSNDILDLTEAQATPPSAPPPNFRAIEGEADLGFAHRQRETPAEPTGRTVDEARRQFVQSAPDRGLLSNAAAAAVDSAFNSLAHTVLGNNARTLEDLVKEMLRPMLKAWLDDNLPGLVERIVRAEIERVARGRP